MILPLQDLKSSAKQNLIILDSLCPDQERLRSCMEAKLIQNEADKVSSIICGLLQVLENKHKLLTN